MHVAPAPLQRLLKSEVVLQPHQRSPAAGCQSGALNALEFVLLCDVPIRAHFNTSHDKALNSVCAGESTVPTPADR
jgi:hypothetical protein